MTAKSKSVKKARVPAAVLTPPRPVAALRDNAIGNLTIQGSKADAAIGGAITEANIERTIEGASTLTVVTNDSAGILTSGGLLDRGRDELLDNTVGCSLDGLLFDLTRVERNYPATSLIFEDDVVSVLRSVDSFRKAYRDKMTRAQFVYSMIREVAKFRKIGFYCPELLDKQAIAKSTEPKSSKTGADDDRTPGFSPGAKIKVKGAAASKDQVKAIQADLAQGAKRGCSDRVLQAIVMCITVESNAGDPKERGHGDSAGPDSRGDYQQRDSWGSLAARMDHAKSTDLFLNAWKHKHGSLKADSGDLGARIQAVQIGPPGSVYNAFAGEAAATVKAFTGGKGGLVSSGRTRNTRQVKERYQFARGAPGKKETSWACMQRLAEEVGWRCFAVGSTIVFASEDELLKQKPSMTLWQGAPGVDTIDWTWDRGHSVQEATVHGRASRWGAQPGQCVELVDQGPATGRWLVKDIQRSLFSPDVEIGLARPQREKPEPAAVVKTVSTKSSGSGSGSSGGTSTIGGKKVPAKVASLIERCKVISDDTTGYQWGGQHGVPFKDMVANKGLDCSSSVYLALWRADLIGGTSSGVSGDLERYGAAGNGEWFTVCANAGHVFILFHGIPGIGRFDTGGPGGGSGPKLRPESRDSGGFTHRHYPGL